MLSETTIASAISALKIIHGSLGDPSQHFSSEIQREAQDEIVHAIADLLRERDELAELQADAGGWMPVEGHVMLELGPGTTVTFRDGSCAAFGDEHPYPNGYALCRYQPGAPQAGGGVADGLAMPDGEGHFAFVGYLDSGERPPNPNVIEQHVCEIFPFYDRMTAWVLRKGIYSIANMHGKFYRLTMPWEQQAQPAQEGSE